MSLSRTSTAGFCFEVWRGLISVSSFWKHRLPRFRKTQQLRQAWALLQNAKIEEASQLLDCRGTWSIYARDRRRLHHRWSAGIVL